MDGGEHILEYLFVITGIQNLSNLILGIILPEMIWVKQQILANIKFLTHQIPRIKILFGRIMRQS